MTTLTIKLPDLLGWQTQVEADAKRFNVVNVGRRAGKTTFGVDLAKVAVERCRPVGWFSPTYKMLLEAWRAAVETYAPVTQRRNASEHRLEFIGGGLLEFWSLDNPDSARGRRYQRIVVDEAAMVPNLMDAWNFVLRPTLADWMGDAWFLSTPKGRNGFWQLWQLGQDDEAGEWASWQMPSTVNPMIPVGEFEAMKAAMPERIYGQEIEARFLDDAGGVFRNVVASATATLQDGAQAGHEYVMGVDWAQSVDFTVLTVIDMTLGAVVAVDRFNQIDYATQLGRLEAMHDRFRPHVIISEKNSMGAPLSEALQQRGLPVQMFTTTNATKSEIIQSLALAFERGMLAIPNDSTLIGELQAYEATQLPGGSWKYSAPPGMHDDMVMSLALAYSAVYDAAPLLL